MIDLNEAAVLIDKAALVAEPIDQLSKSGFTLTLDEAYHVQQLSCGRRLDRGEKFIGAKMGFTSIAKAKQMGVDDLIIGRLTDKMSVKDGGSISASVFIHPRVEPEIAFLLKLPLEGIVTLAEAMAAVEAVAPAIEIIDSRYRAFKFSLEDVVADNASSSAFVIGAWKKSLEDITDLKMSLELDGQVVETGSSAAIMGNPYKSLVGAARLAGVNNFRLEAGSVVLAGAATAAIEVMPGTHVRCLVQGLGEANFTLAEQAA